MPPPSYSLLRIRLPHFSFFFFFNDTATTEIYTLSLHDALPISQPTSGTPEPAARPAVPCPLPPPDPATSTTIRDRKSTRLNSSHLVISYAVFCLKKKKRRLQVHGVLYLSRLRRPV